MVLWDSLVFRCGNGGGSSDISCLLGGGLEGLANRDYVFHFRLVDIFPLEASKNLSLDLDFGR